MFFGTQTRTWGVGWYVEGGYVRKTTHLFFVHKCFLPVFLYMVYHQLVIIHPRIASDIKFMAFTHKSYGTMTFCYDVPSLLLQNTKWIALWSKLNILDAVSCFVIHLFPKNSSSTWSLDLCSAIGWMCAYSQQLFRGHQKTYCASDTHW